MSSIVSEAYEGRVAKEGTSMFEPDSDGRTNPAPVSHKTGKTAAFNCSINVVKQSNKQKEINFLIPMPRWFKINTRRRNSNDSSHWYKAQASFLHQWIDFRRRFILYKNEGGNVW